MAWIKVDRGWANVALIVRVLIDDGGNVTLHLMDGTVAKINDQQDAARLLAQIAGQPPPRRDNLIGAYRQRL